MSKLNKLEVIVKKVLENYEITRCDDFMLVLLTYRYIEEETAEIPFRELMANHKFFNLPAFESITRCRRKIQKDNKELTTLTTVSARYLETKEYIKYSNYF